MKFTKKKIHIVAKNKLSFSMNTSLEQVYATTAQGTTMETRMGINIKLLKNYKNNV